MYVLLLLAFLPTKAAATAVTAATATATAAAAAAAENRVLIAATDAPHRIPDFLFAFLCPSRNGDDRGGGGGGLFRRSARVHGIPAVATAAGNLSICAHPHPFSREDSLHSDRDVHCHQTVSLTLCVWFLEDSSVSLLAVFVARKIISHRQFVLGRENA